MKETPSFKVISVNLSSWRVAPQEIIINNSLFEEMITYASVIQKRWRKWTHLYIMHIISAIYAFNIA